LVSVHIITYSFNEKILAQKMASKNKTWKVFKLNGQYYVGVLKKAKEIAGHDFLMNLLRDSTKGFKECTD